MVSSGHSCPVSSCLEVKTCSISQWSRADFEVKQSVYLNPCLCHICEGGKLAFSASLMTQWKLYSENTKIPRDLSWLCSLDCCQHIVAAHVPFLSHITQHFNWPSHCLTSWLLCNKLNVLGVTLKNLFFTPPQTKKYLLCQCHTF